MSGPDLMDWAKSEREFRERNYTTTIRVIPSSPRRLNRQQEKVLDALQRAGPRGMTGWQLLMASHVMRYTERVRELRRMGYVIPCTRTGKTFDGESIFNYTLKTGGL